jgi:hypothetical protein
VPSLREILQRVYAETAHGKAVRKNYQGGQDETEESEGVIFGIERLREGDTVRREVEEIGRTRSI